MPKIRDIALLHDADAPPDDGIAKGTESVSSNIHFKCATSSLRREI
jgi:hypothetical protein